MDVNRYRWTILERRELSIFPVVLVMQAFTSKMKELVGVNLKHYIMDYKRGSLTALRDHDNWDEVSKLVYEYVKRNPTCLKDITDLFFKHVSGLTKHAQIMGQFKDRMDSKEATFLFNEYCDLYINASVYGECVPFTIKDVLAAEFNERLLSYENNYDIIAKLSIPLYVTFTMREETEFLKKLKKYKKQPTRKNEIISNHHKDFAWITYDYDGEIWTEADIKRKFEENIILSEPDIDKKLKNLELFVSSTIEDEKECIGKNKVSVYIQVLAGLIKDSIKLMDVRKECLTKVHYYSRNFFFRMAEYLNIERKYTSYVLPYGYSDIVRSKNINALLERYNSSTVYMNEDGWKLINDFDVNIYLNQHNKEWNKVKGMCAYPGKLEGRVSIVKKVEDIRRFNEGDVLVSTMTTVDFVEAMKKASAIITDDGGIICHAAILCREMKKPCIVGTKIATNVFKNGDMILIDAGQGIAFIK
jgi:phosphohistidine swiveling domain-containing protein